MKPQRSGWRIWPIVVILRYWLVQGTLYMNWVERLHRWCLEAGIFLVLWGFLGGPSVSGSRIIGIMLVVHTLSALLNGHLFAMLTHDLYWFSPYKEPRRFLAYLETMRERLIRESPQFVSGVVFFGSLSRGVFRESSDLDIRFLPAVGIWNEIRTAQLVFRERLKALFAGFPIDAYMFRSSQEVARKMDLKMECPVVIFQNGNSLSGFLSVTQSFDFFRERFLKTAIDRHE